ncbi:hypothetical protein Tco_1242382, partial [Tanacetum coccineum]
MNEIWGRYEGEAREMTTIKLTLEEYIKNARDEYEWKMVETEVLNLLKISDDLFSCETPLGMTFEEFKRLSSINDDLFDYEVKVPKPTYAPYVEQQTGYLSKKDLGNYKWKMSYKECEKIYAEAVILIDKRFVRLIDATVEQWLDLKYGDHKTMDENVKKGGDDEVELTDEEISNIEDEDGSEMDEKAKIFRIETNLFDFETPLCKAFNEFSYLLK